MPDRRHLRKKRIEAEVTTEPGTLGYWARQHLRSLELHNYSATTLNSRTKELRYFLVWCEERAITKPLDVTVSVLERYQRHMFYNENERGQKLSFRAQAGRLTAIRVLFRWLVKQRVIDMSPAELIELPRPEFRLPKDILSVSDVEAIIGACDPGTMLGIRNRAIIELLYSSGLRRFEVVQLKVWDVNTSDRILGVRQGKGKRDRFVPIGERAALWIGKYIDEVRPHLVSEPDSGHLFLTAQRQPLVPDRVSEIVRSAARDAGLTRTISAHLFRHTMATMMLDGGADVRYVQAMLGHQQLSTTEIYTRVAIRKLKDVHAFSHPAAKLQQPSGDSTDLLDERDELLSSLAAEALEEE